MIGKKFGPTVFDRPKSRFFNPEYVVKAEAFFAKHGRRPSCSLASYPSCAPSCPPWPAPATCTTAPFTYNITG